MNEKVKGLGIMDNWFTIDKIDYETIIISEYRHWEETHCYLLNGKKKSLLIDTGLGISNIYDEVRNLTDKPIAAVATHIHWDHIGGHKYFPEFAHHSLDIQPEILIRMASAFRQLKADGKLHHGSGTYHYGDWGVWL